MSDETKKLTKEQFDESMAQLRLKREELELRRLQRDVENLELGDQNLMTKAKQNGNTLRANQSEADAVMKRCNHKKGGKGLEAVKGGGRGSDSKYAVIKHQLPNGVVAVLCQRCPTIWLPPVQPKRENYATPTLYQQALAAMKKEAREYGAALEFPTDNEMSTSGLWQGGNFVQDSLAENHNTAGHNG